MPIWPSWNAQPDQAARLASRNVSHGTSEEIQTEDRPSPLLLFDAPLSEVARRHDLNANLLFSWRRVMGRVEPASADEPTRFVPAVIVTEAEAASPQSVPPPPAGAMEIVLVDGARVIVDRAVDGAALARVIEALSRR